MGRKKKYNTEEEKREADRRKWMRYYDRNKEKRQKNARDRYWKMKENKNVEKKLS